MDYTVVIRTLGKAGNKYQILLNSLLHQSITPTAIIVYIADGYSIPAETINREQYIYVHKGMVAQRALQYNEVQTEYILFLDDDVYLPPDAVEKMFNILSEHHADVVSPDVFPNSSRKMSETLLMTISGRTRARKDDGVWGYKIMRNAGYSYNRNPHNNIYLSQTNAGPCFLCTKDNYLKIHFEEELWLDKLKYAQGDDQTMFYKMYKKGLKQLTWFNSGIVHLDAGSTTNDTNKTNCITYSDFRFKTIFWHRFIYLPDKSSLSRLWSIICIGYTFAFSLLVSLIKMNFTILNIKINAIKDGISFVRSAEYKQIPRIVDHTK